MPTTLHHLKPTAIEPSVVIEQLRQRQELRKKQYDNRARPLLPLQHNEQVRTQN